MPPTKFWAEMSWRDFAAADMARTVAVLPLAAIEQHGPHLPVGTDAFIGEGYLERAIARTPADWPVLFLPPQTIGASDEHAEYPGTLTLPLTTLVETLTAIGEGVARAGCRKLVFINAHGGNVPAIDAAALRLRARHAMLCVHASWRRLGYPDGLFSERERVYGVHGGDAETSLTLAFRPDTVKRTGRAISPAPAKRWPPSSNACAAPNSSASPGWRATSIRTAPSARPRRRRRPRARPPPTTAPTRSSSCWAT